jgi:hypothetical protein
MAKIPSAIVLKRDRDLEGRRAHLWVRRALFGLVVAVPVLALANLFGQVPENSTATSASAGLRVHAPSRVRGGLLYQARFDIEARRELADAVLVLDRGWLEGMTVNTIEPAPSGETSENGRLRLELGKIKAGAKYSLFMAFQVNPTNIGHRSQRVWLRDGNTPLLSVGRSITVFP